LEQKIKYFGLLIGSITQRTTSDLTKVLKDENLTQKNTTKHYYVFVKKFM